MKRLLGLTIFALALCLAGAGTASATTYYIAANGSDSNNGTTKTTPWLHAPGMAGCSSGCAAASPKPGDSFLFRGGDTWTISSQWTWSWGGTNGNYIVIGVDQTWHSGGTWTRPIFTGAGTYPGNGGGAFLAFASGTPSYLDIGYLEFTGLNWSVCLSGAVDSYIGMTGNSSGILVHDNYFHGWTHSAGVCEDNNAEAVASYGGNGDNTNKFYRNVISGADTTKDSFMGLEDAPFGEVYQNQFEFIEYAMNGTCHLVHDNTLLSVGFLVYAGGVSHTGEMISNLDAPDGCIFYNNVVRYSFAGGSGGVPIWQTPNLGKTSYAFNNVFPDSPPIGGTALWCGEFFISNSSGGGTCTWFNNTMECGADSNPSNTCFRIGTGQPGVHPAAINEYNNHTIGNVAVNYLSPECVSACTLTVKNSVAHTKSAANAQGYSMGQTYPFSPTLVTNSTVGTGLNESALCTAIGAISATAGTACLSDTTYGVSYNPANHTVSWPARTPVARPGVGPWDIGAYQFNSSTSGQPNPPTGLAATVN